MSRSLIKNNKLLLIAMAVLQFWSARALKAADGSESSGAGYLMLPVGPRMIAMGDARAAVTGDPFNWLANPASLRTLDQSGIGLFHSEWIMDTRYDHICGTLKLNERVSIAGGIVYQYADDIQGYDQFGTETAMLKNYNYQALVGIAFTPAESFAAGINIKHFRETLDEWSAGGLGLDAGALYTIVPIRTTLGFSVQNMGPEIRFISRKEPLPLAIRGGAAHTLQLPRQNLAFTIAVEGVKPRFDDPYAAVGCEVLILNLVAVRAGWSGQKYRAGDGFAFGGGVRIREQLALDYAATPYGDLGILHMISLYYGIR